jgi:tetratricopeptide (TPR) repeat protein
MTRRICFITALILVSCLVICCTGKNGKPQENGQVSIDQKKPAGEPGSQSGQKDNTPKPDDSLNLTSKSQEELEKYHQENPLDYASAYQLARMYESGNLIKESAAIYLEYLSSPDASVSNRAKLDLAMLYFRTKDYETSYASLKKVVLSSSDDIKSEAFFQLGNLIFIEDYNPPDGEKTALAVGYYSEALKLDPSNSVIYRRLAGLYHADAKLQEARENLAIFLVAYPEDAQSWLDLADWSVEAKDLEKAGTYYKKAIETGDEEIREKAGKSLRKLK